MTGREPLPLAASHDLAQDQASDRQRRRETRTHMVRTVSTIVNVLCGLFAVVLVAHIVMVLNYGFAAIAWLAFGAVVTTLIRRFAPPNPASSSTGGARRDGQRNEATWVGVALSTVDTRPFTGEYEHPPVKGRTMSGEMPETPVGGQPTEGLTLMAHIDPTAGIAEPHQSTVATILRAVGQGLFTAAEADMLIDRIRAHVIAVPVPGQSPSRCQCPSKRCSRRGEWARVGPLPHGLDRTVS